ncbi:hypothetical protein E2C01_058172 [Portunus trituberculatus]|uniref:Uncharacterized protein n=1 Tax=Portunus trituberculatus TaxID=210409 RepID=A0A5B7GZ47_PORTR|nr:hypothetical protein [Portunus trituberculatus]
MCFHFQNLSRCARLVGLQGSVAFTLHRNIPRLNLPKFETFPAFQASRKEVEGDVVFVPGHHGSCLNESTQLSLE